MIRSIYTDFEGKISIDEFSSNFHLDPDYKVILNEVDRYEDILDLEKDNRIVIMRNSRLKSSENKDQIDMETIIADVDKYMKSKKQLDCYPLDLYLRTYRRKDDNKFSNMSSLYLKMFKVIEKKESDKPFHTIILILVKITNYRSSIFARFSIYPNYKVEYEFISLTYDVLHHVEPGLIDQLKDELQEEGDHDESDSRKYDGQT